MADQDSLKCKAAEKAVEHIESGMVMGFGTGSTFNHVLFILSEKLKAGEIDNIVGVPTSEKTLALAQELNIPCGTLSEYPVLDLTIDGADEVDNKLNLIKGGGGALLREKIIAQASKKYFIIVDELKLSDHLGEKWAIPIEIIKIALEVETNYLQSLGAEVKLRKNKNDEPFITDEGNYILDANFGVIKNPKKLAKKLNKRAGIVEHGLFLNLADQVIVASDKGIKILSK
ncbi:MAG: ribose-5-phosphate isomerase RpiA [Chlorobi bacterium]|nr:ribose-5-phosphate isomerase RpiA [Chlorobiota bacterium]